MSKQRPRGIRNNNPGNIEWGDPWQGLVPVNERTDARFAQFETPAYGIRAMARVLITYQDKRTARDGSRIDTVREIIERWAPASENNVDAYVTAVRRGMFGAPNAPTQFLDMHKYEHIRPLIDGIIRHENGRGPLDNANTWYTDATIDEGLRLAGIRKPVDEVAAVPVTKETVGATATGAIGAAQIAEMMPQIAAAMSSADEHLSSGSWVRIALGVATIGVAVFIAYSQVRRKQAGEL